MIEISDAWILPHVRKSFSFDDEPARVHRTAPVLSVISVL